MKIYIGSGHSYLVCPVLLSLDTRLGRHWSLHPPCALKQPCIRPHKHEKELPDGGGHKAVDYHWVAGCRPPTVDEHWICECGQSLVHADLDDLYNPALVIDA